MARQKEKLPLTTTIHFTCVFRRLSAIFFAYNHVFGMIGVGMASPDLINGRPLSRVQFQPLGAAILSTAIREWFRSENAIHDVAV